ncbi:FUSC family protein [Frateuria sp. GZRR35]|uniref:FUSC family protein n=1 Tax=Frateuria sp. GZRR35 TaxID=3351536 RepID=UPI003EDC04B6
MSATTTATLPRWPWLRAFLAEESRAWLFVAKSLLAMYAAAWLAMWLKLEQPSTTMITVAVVMHPHSGMVLAKSFYRALGTLAGSLFGLALIALFPQQRELFFLVLSAWLALCAGGATLYRNFMAYGFVLAGYTAAIVTLPAVGNPLNSFDSAVMRVSEVLLGILVAAVFSDLLLPQRLRVVLRQSARTQFARFIDFVRESTGGALPRARMEQAHLEFVRAAVHLEDLRASVIFEDPEVRTRSARMRLLNQRYMAAATSFQSLHHLINRLQRRGRDAVAQALIGAYRPIGEALSLPPAEQHDPALLTRHLRACVESLPAHVAALGERFDEPAARLEFDTGAALVQRFADELADFTAVEASLRAGNLRGSVERVHFRRGNDLAGAAVATLRTFLTMLVLAAFWLASGWAFGGSAMLLATIFAGLLAASPNPIAAATRTLYGYAGGMAAGFVAVFVLLPGSNGFAMLVCATAGLLLIGPYLATRDTLPGVGAGYTLGFVYILALKNPMVYDPTHFLNDAIAQIAGLGLSGVAFMVMPGVTGTAWQRRRQLQRLREQVTLAASAPLPGLGWRFESISRDLLQQVVAHTRPDSDESRHLLAWSLAVQESGRAVIELRQDLSGNELSAVARDASRAALAAVADLYRAPEAARWESADAAVLAAIHAVPRGASARRHLYQLRSALRDEESPLGAYMPLPETARAA